MNGNLTTVLLWLVSGLLGMVSGLIGFIVYLHMKSDEEHRVLAERQLDLHRQWANDEVDRLRKAMHDVRNVVAELKAKEYFDGKERRKK